MLVEKIGNLLDDTQPGDCIVNTVNCEGVMGKGIALQFKQKYPKMFSEYKKACFRGDIQPGKLWLWTDGINLIINFPTKMSWREPSQYDWIKSGLVVLKEIIKEKQIKTIKIPALGCENGKLDYNRVRNMIIEDLDDVLDDVIIELYRRGG